MLRKWAVFGWTLLIFSISRAWGQYQGVSEKFSITAKSASTWTDRKTKIVQLDGGVTIEMDTITLSADQAVIWLSEVPQGKPDEQQVEIALIGNAELKQTENHVTRSGPKLLVNAVIRAVPELKSPTKKTDDLSDSQLYKTASILRASSGGSGEAGELKPEVTPEKDTDQARARLRPPPGGTAIAAGPSANGKDGPVFFHSDSVEQSATADDHIALVLGGRVRVTQERADGTFLEIMGSRVVLFTDVRSGANMTNFGDHIVAVYMEGDARINETPGNSKKAEQRVTADRIYYDLVTDRAVMTNVVIHTIDPLEQIPVIVRATKARQLSQGEYTVENVELTTSAFAVPTYSIKAGSAYIREYVTEDGEANSEFTAKNDRLEVLGQPIFYIPYVGGNINNDAFPLREMSIGSNSTYGVSAVTDWGLFESLGRPHPEDLDVDFHLDYYSLRGPAFGLNSNYSGEMVTDTTHDPWSFQGDFQSYIIDDKGIDDPGGSRIDVTPPRDLRGQLLWEHQHFFPDDWQVQARAGYVSDPTFLEQYDQEQFDNDQPRNVTLYAKRQKETEAITVLLQANTTTFTTNAAQQTEQFDEERLPEITYHRIGDSLDDDNLTFFSDNSLSRLRFDLSHASLLSQGYYPGLSPGIPATGYTGVNGGPTYRADSQQELDWPVQAGQFKMVPYISGRFTEYSNSPTGDAQSRFFTTAGLRMTTAFWKVDDTVESDFFDIHRVRNVIEPELNLFTSYSTLDRSDIFIYDPDVDGITDVNAAQIALHDRWQTMRGGPDRWRSVDFLEVNVEGNFFTNHPPQNQLEPPDGFRGLFFPSEVQTSIPRSGINGDMTWRISDTTAFLSDAEWNMDQRELATAGAGLAVTRDDRMTYFLGDRYIQALRSQILSFTVDYQLTQKYRISATQSFDFGDTRDINTSATVTRAFDTVSASVSVYHDAITGQSGFNFNIAPLGFAGKTGGGLDSLTGQR